jgi:hypothetical protein
MFFASSSIYNYILNFNFVKARIIFLLMYIYFLFILYIKNQLTVILIKYIFFKTLFFLFGRKEMTLIKIKPKIKK